MIVGIYNNPCAYENKRLTSTSVLVNAAGTAVEISVVFDGLLQEQTKYSLVLAQPVPVAGYNLPVYIVVNFTNGQPSVTEPLKRLYDPHGCGACDLEFGEDLPRYHNQIQLYHTNGGDFIDLRRHERC